MAVVREEITQELGFHEAANEFPLLSGDRFKDLVTSVKQNGIREPITLYDNKILDGRNRYLAWQKLKEEGIHTPLKTRQFEGGDPFQWAWDLNGERRDLTQDQRYLIWKSVNEKSQSWQEEQRRIQDEANKKRSEAAKSQHEVSNPRAGEVLDRPQVVDEPKKAAPRGQGSQAKAAASKTNRGSVERMDNLASKRPDLAEKVKAGEMKAQAALRQMKKDQVKEKVQDLPSSKYRVIYADPPWKYGDSRTNLGTATGAEHHYPTMSISELCDLGIKDLADDNAVLFLWTTSPLLEDSFKVINAWGFKYKSSFIWDKVGHNLGHYNSEDTLRARGIADQPKVNFVESYGYSTRAGDS